MSKPSQNIEYVTEFPSWFIKEPLHQNQNCHQLRITLLFVQHISHEICGSVETINFLKVFMKWQINNYLIQSKFQLVACWGNVWTFEKLCFHPSFNFLCFFKVTITTQNWNTLPVYFQGLITDIFTYPTVSCTLKFCWFLHHSSFHVVNYNIHSTLPVCLMSKALFQTLVLKCICQEVLLHVDHFTFQDAGTRLLSGIWYHRDIIHAAQQFLR